MGKISDMSDPRESALQNSLGAIKQAHDQLDFLTYMGTTAAVLAWQIELCDVLLFEISGIRSSLVKDLDHTRGGPQPGRQPGLNS